MGVLNQVIMDAVADIERERDDGMRARASKRVVTLQTGTNRRLYFPLSRLGSVMN
jgi:hypothetical protein